MALVHVGRRNCATYCNISSPRTPFEAFETSIASAFCNILLHQRPALLQYIWGDCLHQAGTIKLQGTPINAVNCKCVANKSVLPKSCLQQLLQFLFPGAKFSDWVIIYLHDHFASAVFDSSRIHHSGASRPVGLWCSQRWHLIRVWAPAWIWGLASILQGYNCVKRCETYIDCTYQCPEKEALKRVIEPCLAPRSTSFNYKCGPPVKAS